MTATSPSYICTACGWSYDPVQGNPDGGIAPGTPWEAISDDWMCPVCGAGKAEFERYAQPVIETRSRHSQTPP